MRSVEGISVVYVGQEVNCLMPAVGQEVNADHRRLWRGGSQVKGSVPRKASQATAVYGGEKVNSEIDLSQITADLTALMTEVDRIEAIAAGKTPADTDEPWPSDRLRERKP